MSHFVAILFYVYLIIGKFLLLCVLFRKIAYLFMTRDEKKKSGFYAFIYEGTLFRNVAK